MIICTIFQDSSCESQVAG